MPLDGVKARPGGFSLWGLVRPATGAPRVTVLVRRRGARSYRTLKTVATDSLGYWTPAAPRHAASSLARALDEPDRRQVRRAADPRLLGALPPEPARGAPAAYDGGVPELPEVEITARLLDGALRGARIESALAPGINALKTFDPPLVGSSRGGASRRCGAAAST